jgi:hypothetical protein
MLINRKFFFAAVIALALGASSCRKFMNVNTNPNVSQTATVQTLLPAAELYVGSSVGTDLQVIGSIWAQFWTQTPAASQYVLLEQYAPGQDQFSYAWQDLYSGAENFYQLYNLADTQKKKQYKAIALLMQAYTFQVITDGWGDVPFKQALKGQFANGHMVNPMYDSQKVVYNGILAYIDSAKKLIGTGNAAGPGADDLIYGGDMAKWSRFANTLELKILLRMIYIDPLAPKKINTFYNSNPAFIGTGDDAKIAYGFNTANKNPLYAEESSAALSGIQNLGGSKTCIDSMKSNNDYREGVFYNPGAGIAQGTYNISLPAGSYAIPSIYVGGDVNDPNQGSANAPVNLLTSWESYFLQAEAAVRGLGNNTGGDATLFYQGIKASFNYYDAAMMATSGVSADSAYRVYINGDPTTAITPGHWAVYPAAGNPETRLEYIITQKWFAMCGNQGFEAWTEWRRTGYPRFLVTPPNSLIGKQQPKRFLYPTTESTVNANFPGLKPLTFNVWWGTK